MKQMVQQKPLNNRWAIIVFRIVFTMLLFGIVVFIFSNSSQIGSLSGVRSRNITQFINQTFQKLGFGLRLSDLQVRKMGHLAEYMLLGFWFVLTLRVYTSRVFAFVSWPLFCGLLVAVLDEYYQGFVVGRSSQVSDVLIDFIGVLFGLGVGVFLIFLVGGAVSLLRTPQSRS